MSWKDKKSKRGSLAVSDAEVQAAMPKTRLQLREKMVNDGVLSRNRTSLVDLRSTSSRNKLPTQIGSSLSRTENRPTGKPRTFFFGKNSEFSRRVCSGYEVPSYMSDKQKQRIANDPIRALKYGGQLAGFSDDFNKAWLY